MDKVEIINNNAEDRESFSERRDTYGNYEYKLGFREIAAILTGKTIALSTGDEYSVFITLDEEMK